MIDIANARALLLVDGPNIDATLGMSVLARKPAKHERPRWERVIQFFRSKLGVDKAWFVLNGDKFCHGRAPFYRCLKHLGYEVATPRCSDWCQSDGDDPVDEWIKHLLDCSAVPECLEVVLLSHDGGFAPALKGILDVGGAVTVAGFLEWFAPALASLRADGAVLLDLEHDVGAFDVRLNRPEVKPD